MGVAVAGGLTGMAALRPAPVPALPRLPPPRGTLATYHLGHSLVGRDMPAMLAQLAGHDHASQLGWGASLAQHRTGDVPGFAAENTHPAHRPVAEAMASGRYDALVVTEMVELRDALRWHDSAVHLAHWAARARAGNPSIRVFLYETWHRLDDPVGWLNRIDGDMQTLWLDRLLYPASQEAGPIYLIPGGQVMAAAARAAEAGLLPGLTDRRQFFATGPDGRPDTIHFNDLGAWLMALTHYAVMYQRPPVGLPHRLARADDSPAHSVPEAAAKVLQQVVWQVVTRYPATGMVAAVG
ncbi:hypothetical protein JI744_16135 [Tabrizicola sp. KVB23]|uniref:Uncharacterized protein n=2 Tax=Fuscibacter oryzae TaxID=2803939 RepID=A0A8J7MV56_9RHOB|nr:hypothetical protein [Fuscibacter oryzae]